MGSIIDAENFEGHFKVIRGHSRSNGVNIGVWTPNLVGGVNSLCQKLKITSRSLGVIQGQMGTHLCMDMKLGR